MVSGTLLGTTGELYSLFRGTREVDVTVTLRGAVDHVLDPHPIRVHRTASE